MNPLPEGVVAIGDACVQYLSQLLEGDRRAAAAAGCRVSLERNAGVPEVPDVHRNRAGQLEALSPSASPSSSLVATVTRLPVHGGSR